MAQAGILRTLGVKGSFSSSGRNSQADSQFERRIGVNLGAEVEWGFGNYFSMHSDFEYSQRGWKTKATDSQSAEKTDLSYVSIPVLFQFSVPAVIVKPYIQIGPRLDILTKISSDTYGNSIPKDWSKTLVGGSVAAGAQIQKFHPIIISGTARYNFDFANLSSAQDIKVKNNSLDVWVGVGYGFGPKPMGQ
jgi:hypothetical protein